METCEGSVCLVRGYMDEGINEKLQGVSSWIMKKICYGMVFIHVPLMSLWVSKFVT